MLSRWRQVPRLSQATDLLGQSFKTNTRAGKPVNCSVVLDLKFLNADVTKMAANYPPLDSGAVDPWPI